MPFAFSSVCDLLNCLERLQLRDPPHLYDKLRAENSRTVEEWFRRHRRSIDARDTDGVALLSTLFPERRADRVYHLKEASLCKVLARCLHFTNKKMVELQAWKIPGHGDLGTCLENVLKPFDCEPKPGKPGAIVTVEEVNKALEELASQCHFSGPHVRASFPASTPPAILETIFLRLKSSEAKWMTRLILKDFSPVVLDTALVLREFHFLLPGLLQFQDSFKAAIPLLRGTLSKWHSKPDSKSQRIFKKEAADLVYPQVGVKVGRPPFIKARSMANAVQMAGCQTWSVERKYDGEYCEVHIDLDKGKDCIQIFSKSSKDSTKDRQKVHGAIRECLRIGHSDCFFKRRCIVLGELVVWSEKDRQILGFEKIRKHVSRSGLYIGTEEDSQPHPGEKLMVVFFDVLLVDDDIVMRKPHVERRSILSKKLICKKEGCGITAEWKTIDFSRKEEASYSLCREFAAALSYRVEGLVMKPSDMPYFAFDDESSDGKRAYFIKVKKDYMHELGGERDVADFAIVGASYDPKQAQKSGLKRLQYTTFHLGCLRNEESLRFHEIKPVFEIVGSICQEQCIPKSELQALNDYGRFCSKPFERSGNGLKDPSLFDLSLDQNPSSKMSVIFTEPFVVEVLGSNFEKPSNKSYFMLRHPRILKLHLDRTWKDTITLSGLERMANEARSAPAEGESQELSQLTKKFIDKFENKRGKQTGLCEMSTQGSAHSTSPRSIRRSPASSRPSPTLVRIDTDELLPGERRPAELLRIPIPENSGDSLPTPPGSSGNTCGSTSNTAGQHLPCSIDSQSNKRRKERSPSPLMVKRVRIESDRISNPRPLINISDKRTSMLPKPAPSVHATQNQSSTPLPYHHTMYRLTESINTGSCTNTHCLFAQAVAYLSPCISSYSWVTDGLLKWHGTERTEKLIYWHREIQDLTPSGPTVSESPAWPGLQKVIFLETNRKEASMDCVAQVKDLKIRDEILFFDWRVLEELRAFDAVFDGSERSIWSKHYFGHTKWDKKRLLVQFYGTDHPLPWSLEFTEN
jgi:DNA ligase-4